MSLTVSYFLNISRISDFVLHLAAVATYIRILCCECNIISRMFQRVAI